MANNETMNSDYLFQDDPEYQKALARIREKEKELAEMRKASDEEDAFLEAEFAKSDKREQERKAQKQASANNIEIKQPQKPPNQDNVNILPVEPKVPNNSVKTKKEISTKSLSAVDYKSLGRVNIDIAKNNYLVMANSFIKSCVVTPNADARKLFYLAVSEIRQEDDDLKPIHTHARDLMEIFGEKSTKKIYTRANKACENLFKNSYIYKKNNKNKWKGCHLTSYVEYDNGDIYITLNPNLKPFFLHLQRNFTQTIFRLLLQLPSQDAMTLYNLLYMNYCEKTSCIDKNTGVGTFIFTKEEIEELFEGQYYYCVEKNKKDANKRYSSLGGFNFFLLNPAIKAINKSGLLNVEMKTKKNSNHEIGWYIFKVSLGENYSTLIEERDNQIQERQEEKELKLINLFFYKRFAIKSYNKDAKTEKEGTIEKLREKGVSLVQLKLAAIQMQAYLNSTSDCIWEQKAYENNTTEAKTSLRNPYRVLETIITKNRYAKKITQFDKATDYAELERKGIHISQLSKFNGADYDLDLVKAYEESEQVASDINLLFENVLETLDTVPNPFWDGIRKEAL